jgi:hypothetical protein
MIILYIRKVKFLTTVETVKLLVHNVCLNLFFNWNISFRVRKTIALCRLGWSYKVYIYGIINIIRNLQVSFKLSHFAPGPSTQRHQVVHSALGAHNGICCMSLVLSSEGRSFAQDRFLTSGVLFPCRIGFWHITHNVAYKTKIPDPTFHPHIYICWEVSVQVY